MDRHGDGAVFPRRARSSGVRAPWGMRHYGRVTACGEDVRDALVRQWQAIAAALPAVDLDVPSRVDGWRNREVVAHLCLQLVVLRRFVATASMQHAMVSLAANLAGTHSLVTDANPTVVLRQNGRGPAFSSQRIYT